MNVTTDAEQALEDKANEVLSHHETAVLWRFVPVARPLMIWVAYDREADRFLEICELAGVPIDVLSARMATIH